MKRFTKIGDSIIGLFLTYVFLFTLLFLAIASAALRGVMNAESNPFFYAGF